MGPFSLPLPPTCPSLLPSFPPACPQEASRAYLRAYAIDPSNAGALGNHCNILQSVEGREGGGSEQAGEDVGEGGEEAGAGRVEGCYLRLIQAHPEYDRAYVNLGGYYYTQGEMEKSAAWYMKALEHNPQNAIAAHALGALGGEKLEGASLAYLAELFDSYSATFDASLHALEYKSPELLRRAVDGHLEGEGEAGKVGWGGEEGQGRSRGRAVGTGGRGGGGPLERNVCGEQNWRCPVW